MTELVLKVKILLVNMLSRIDSGITRILESANVGNNANTPPRAVVGLRDRWQVVTRHEDLAGNAELILVSIQSASCHTIATSVLFHDRSVDLLIIIRLAGVDVATALDRNDIWIG